MDPLSRLPRAPPGHTSPVHDNEFTIKTDSNLVEKQERQAESAPARTAFHIWSLEDCLEGRQSAWHTSAETQGKPDALDELPASPDYWSAQNPPPNLHIAIDEKFLQDWIEGYQSDHSFGPMWNDVKRES